MKLRLAKVGAHVDVKGPDGFWYRAAIREVKKCNGVDSIYVYYPRYRSHSEWVNAPERVRKPRSKEQIKAENEQLQWKGADGRCDVDGRTAYTVDKLVGKRKRGGSVEYEVLWEGDYEKGGVQKTWERASNLLDRQLIEDYNAGQRAQKKEKAPLREPSPFILTTQEAKADLAVQQRRAEDAAFVETRVGVSAAKVLGRQTTRSQAPLALCSTECPAWLALALHRRIRSMADGLGRPHPRSSCSHTYPPGDVV